MTPISRNAASAPAGPNAASPPDPLEVPTVEPRTVLGRRPSPEVDWVEVQGEIVAWNAQTESLHLLDPVAAVVFQLLDGVASLEETSRDLAEAFGRDLDQVRCDVLAFAGSLVRNRLAEVVR